MLTMVILTEKLGKSMGGGEVAAAAFWLGRKRSAFFKPLVVLADPAVSGEVGG